MNVEIPSFEDALKMVISGGIVTPPDVAINFCVARKIKLKIPISFFESAAFIYDYEGNIARAFGQTVK